MKDQVPLVLWVGERQLKAVARKEGVFWHVRAERFPELSVADRDLPVAQRKLAKMLEPKCREVEASRAAVRSRG